MSLHFLNAPLSCRSYVHKFSILFCMLQMWPMFNLWKQATIGCQWTIHSAKFPLQVLRKRERLFSVNSTNIFVSYYLVSVACINSTNLWSNPGTAKFIYFAFHKVWMLIVYKHYQNEWYFYVLIWTLFVLHPSSICDTLPNIPCN